VIAPPRPVEEPLGILFSDVTRLFWRRLEAAFHAEGFDFTSAEARVLISLEDAGEPGGVRQARLADMLHIEPMTLCGHLERLEAKGMIERRPDSHDRRAKLVRPSLAGFEVVGRLRRISSAIKAAMVAGLAEDEIRRLADLLPRLRTNLAALVVPTTGDAA
jgi:DNA-binding MarR family transcriptional regulator